MDVRPVFPIDQSIDQTCYYWFETGFSSEEVNLIVKNAKNYESQKATIVGEDKENTIRKSNIKWLPVNDEWNWVYERLSNQIIEANKALWQFNLHTIIDNIQFTEYEGNGGHYDWHLDIGPKSINHRKVSVIVQLSNPDDYVGGDLELHPGSNYFAVPRGKGTVVVFPSFLLHRVTPLTSGLRRSLVLWAGGEPYK